MKKKPHFLKVSLHGMNTRAHKLMVHFLEVTCKGIARVVEESESDIQIIDADLARPLFRLEEWLSKQPSKPIIMLSLNKISFDNIIYIKKPINKLSISKALQTAEKNILDQQKKLAIKKRVSTNKADDSIADKTKANNIKKLSNSINSKPLQTTALITEASLLDLDNTAMTLNNNTVATAKPDTFRPYRAKKEYQRATVRHSFTPIMAKIQSDSLVDLNAGLPVLVLNIDSQGALIEFIKPLSLPKEITLEIQFDLQHFFTILANVVRNEGKSTYGLKFLDPQYELYDFLA